MTISRRQPAGLALLLAAALAPGTGRTAPEPRPAASCPRGQGEFPPTDCAVVAGRALDPAGRPLAGYVVRVDSFVRTVAYAYASDTATIAADGSFALLVHRINRLRPPASPDTATVEIKVYRGSAWRPSDAPVGRAPVRMRFAPLGTRVDATPASIVVAVP